MIRKLAPEGESISTPFSLSASRKQKLKDAVLSGVYGSLARKNLELRHERDGFEKVVLYALGLILANQMLQARILRRLESEVSDE